MTNSVCLAYVKGTHESTSFQESWEAQIGFLLTHQPDVLDGGKLPVRYGTGGIVEARNRGVEMFLESDTEWLWWVDTDMGFEPDTVLRLLEAADPVERPIVGALCFAANEVGQDGFNGYRVEPRPTIFDWVVEDDVARFMGRTSYRVNALTRCGATGSACVLIHRSVFEKIGSGWYDPMLNPSTGKVLGEDVGFCARATMAGFATHVHTGVRTTHHKEFWLGESDWFRWVTPPQATEGVTVVVPVLNRPQNVTPFVNSLRASTGLARPLFMVDEDDDAELETIDLSGEDYAHPTGSTFAMKVNSALAHTDDDWIFICGDDVRFRAGWLDHALHVAETQQAMVVGTNDLGNPAVMAGAHATHMLINRSYIQNQGASWDGPGTVCHEGYLHNFVDNEIVTVARSRGVYASALGSIVEHMHPAWGKGEVDEVYELGQSSYKQDEQLFRSRVKMYG